MIKSKAYMLQRKKSTANQNQTIPWHIRARKHMINAIIQRLQETHGDQIEKWE